MPRPASLTILWLAGSSAGDPPAVDTQISSANPDERRNQRVRFQCSGRNVSNKAPRFLRRDTLRIATGTSDYLHPTRERYNGHFQSNNPKALFPPMFRSTTHTLR